MLEEDWILHHHTTNHHQQQQQQNKQSDGKSGGIVGGENGSSSSSNTQQQHSCSSAPAHHDGYELQYVAMLARHGARYPTSKKMDKTRLAAQFVCSLAHLDHDHEAKR